MSPRWLGGSANGIPADLESKAATPKIKYEPAAVIRRGASSGAYNVTGAAYRPFWDTDRIITDAYERTAIVWSCINAIASDESSLPIVFRKGDRDNGHLIEDHAHLDILNVRANSFEAAQTFRYRLSTLLFLSRLGVMVEKVRTNGRVTSLVILPVGRTFPVPDSKKWVSGYEVWVTMDGAQTITLPAEDVIWFKRPHPTDPYLSMTPLQAAGISIDMAYLARLYNRNFMANDGRPGGILGVKGQIDEEDAEIMRARFSGGPGEAGKITVLEADDLEFIDTATTPRDAQYTQSIQVSANDIMTTLGVPESILGNASGRTFSNADSEERNYWRRTMRNHNSIIDNTLTADPDMGSGLSGTTWIAHDTSGIAVLQKDEVDRLSRLKDEWDSGLITQDEYRKERGLIVFNQPMTRALWAAPRFVVGADAADVHLIAQQMVDQTGSMPTDQLQQALDMAAAQTDPANSQGGDDTPEPGSVGASSDPGSGPDGEPESKVIRPDFPQPGPGVPTASVSEGHDLGIVARAAKALAAGDPQADALLKQAYETVSTVAESLGIKAAELDIEGQRNSDRQAAQRQADSDEADLQAVLARLVERQRSDVLKRLHSAKVRAGTKHWQPAPVESKALNLDLVLNPSRWIPEAIAALRPVMARLFAVDPADTSGDTDSLEGQPPAQPDEQPQQQGQDGDSGHAGSVAAILAAVALIRAARGASSTSQASRPAALVAPASIGEGDLNAAKRLAYNNAMADLIANMEVQADKVRERIEAADSAGAGIEDITAAVEQSYDAQRDTWVPATTRHTVTGAVNETAMLSGTYGGLTTAEWLSSRDDHVRPTHGRAGADGQKIDMTDPAARFIVGGFPLRYPGDPAGPPQEVRGCRCRLRLTRDPHHPQTGIKSAGPDYSTGVMVALRPDADTIKRMVVENGCEPGDLHVTLAYLGKMEDLPAEQAAALPGLVASLITGMAPITATVSAVTNFTAEDGKPVPCVALIDSPQITDLHAALSEALADFPVSKTHGFTAHMTLGYDMPDIPPVPEGEIGFPAVGVEVGPKSYTYSLSKEPVMASKDFVAAVEAFKGFGGAPETKSSAEAFFHAAQARFTESLHPRHHGKFVDKPDADDTAKLAEEIRHERASSPTGKHKITLLATPRSNMTRDDLAGAAALGMSEHGNGDVDKVCATGVGGGMVQVHVEHSNATSREHADKITRDVQRSVMGYTEAMPEVEKDEFIPPKTPRGVVKPTETPDERHDRVMRQAQEALDHGATQAQAARAAQVPAEPADTAGTPDAGEVVQTTEGAATVVTTGTVPDQEQQEKPVSIEQATPVMSPNATDARLMTMDPVAIDTELQPIVARAGRASGLLHANEDYLKKMTKEYALFQQAKAEGKFVGNMQGRHYNEKSIADQQEKVDALQADLDAILAERAPYDAEFKRRGGWTRAFLVLNRNGHVHTSMNCSTCQYNTDFGWLPEMSGHSETELVEKAGSDICTVCVPSAEVYDEKRPRPRTILHASEIEANAARDQRAVAKAEKDAAKAAKAISDEDGSPIKHPTYSDKIDTIAKGKNFLTDHFGHVDRLANRNAQRAERGLPADDLVAETEVAHRVAKALARKNGTTPEEEMEAARKRQIKRGY